MIPLTRSVFLGPNGRRHHGRTIVATFLTLIESTSSVCADLQSATAQAAGSGSGTSQFLKQPMRTVKDLELVSI